MSGSRTSRRMRSQAPALEGVEHPPRGGRHLDLVVLADQRFAQDEREILVVLGDQDPLSQGLTFSRARS